MDWHFGQCLVCPLSVHLKFETKVLNNMYLTSSVGNGLGVAFPVPLAIKWFICHLIRKSILGNSLGNTHLI